MSLSHGSSRYAFDIAGVKRSIRHFEDPRNNGRVREGDTTVSDDDMPAANGVLPIVF